MRIPTEFIAIDKFSSVVSKMTSGVTKFSDSSSSAVQRFNANKVAGSMAVAGTAIIAPLGLAINRAVEFEDKMADVAKTTGLSGKELDSYGKSILDMSKKTRTGIDDLIKIGEIGGQLGIAKKDLVSFTEASNKFAVALGADYGGTEQAISQIGKINMLFKDTRGLDASSSITKVGSAINELGAVGAGTSSNINDFILRIGALPDAIKPTLTQTAALGTFFEEVGIDAQIASGGFSNFLLVAGKNIGGFAAQMKMGTSEAKALFAQDPTKFATIFAKSLNGLKPDVLAKKLEKLKIGSQESIKVLGALGSGSQRLGTLLDVSSDAFVKATSLTDEYNKKNDTTAAKLAMAKNNMDALAITIGTQLAPILNKLVETIVPVIDRFGKWIENNPKLTQTIAKLGLGLLILSGVVKTITMITSLWTLAQWALNVAMTANPIGLIIVGIAALIALVVAAVVYFKEWGAAILMLIGPIGWVINMFMNLGRHWDSIVEAFKTDGIIAGFKRLGVVILDFVLFPIEQMLKLLSYIPGLDTLLSPALDGIKDFRASLDLNEKVQIESPEQIQSQNTQANTLKGGLNINVNDPNKRATTESQFGGTMPINLTSTQGAF